MTDLTQLPGTQNIRVGQLDDVTVSVNFNQDMSGYTMTAFVYPLSGAVAVSLTFAWVSQTAGTCTVTATHAQNTALPVGENTWALILTAGSLVREMIRGIYEVKEA